MTDTLKTRNVFIDTEVFVRTMFNFNSASFKKLASLAENDKIFVYSTNITN
jgi:hypothetical protein